MISRRKIIVLSALILGGVSPQAFASSVMGSLSDYVLSSCKSFGTDEKTSNTLKGILQSKAQVCRSDEDLFAEINASAEEQLFHNLIKKQIQHQQCQQTKIKGLISALQNDPELENYLHSSLMLQLTELRGLEYKLARMKMTLQNQRNDCQLAQALPFVSDETAHIYRNETLNVNYSCPAKKMSQEAAEAAVVMSFTNESALAESIEALENEIALVKSQIPFAAAPKIQDLIQKHTLEARSQARSDQMSSKTSILDLEGDVKQQAKLYNENFEKVQKTLADKQAIQEFFKDYEERLMKSQRDLEKTKTRSGQYKPDDDLKRQIFKGPMGEEFVAQALVNSNKDNAEDVKNMLCRLDAHYGTQRNKTEAYVDMGLGAATIALTALEMTSGVGSAAVPVTAAAALQRLNAAINVISNSKYVHRGIVAVSAASAGVGIVQAVEKCKAPLAQVKECKPFSKENMTAELKLSACLGGIGMAVVGAGGLAISSIRNTEVGQEALENLSKISFKEKFYSEMNKKLTEVPEYRALYREISERGDFSGLAKLSKEQQVEFLTSYHNHNRVRISTAELNLKKPNLSKTQRAEWGLELSQAKKNKVLLDDVIQKVSRREVSHQMTAPAQLALDMVKKFEKAVRAGISSHNVTKEE